MCAQTKSGSPADVGLKHSDMAEYESKSAPLVLQRSLTKLSFRWQIALLGALVLILCFAVLFAALAALHYTRSAILSDETRNLSETAEGLAREYSNRAKLAQENQERPPLDNPSAPSSQDVLTLTSRVFLQNADGVEGGFYSSASDALLGYSFPTGSLNQSQALGSDDERAPILDLARSVAETDRPGGQVLAGMPSVVLIEAAPIGDGTGGSAWVLKRLSTVPGTNRLRTYLIAAGLGVVALACVVLTLVVVRNLQLGVRKIENGLQSLERDLSSQVSAGGDPDEIERIAEAINRLAATLRTKIERERQIEDQLRHSERLAALGRLVAGVAHEVRNPLATIRLRIQMCQRDSNSPKVQNSCVVALEEIERLNGIVSRLLTFAQPVHLDKGPMNLSDLAAARLDTFRFKAQKAGVQFIVNLAQDGGVAQIDGMRITQVFDNIIQNAIEAMPDSGGTLWVDVRCDLAPALSQRVVCVEFRDSGKGIHSGVIGRVFDPFFTTKSNGTGLGLSICHELVRAHGGEIRIESFEGLGTTVRVFLPSYETVAELAHRGMAES